HRLTTELGKRRLERIADPRIEIAKRPDDQDPAVAENRRDIPQQEQGGLVRRVQVVEEERKGSFGRAGLQKRCGRVEEPKTSRLGPAAARLLGGQAGKELAQL